MMEFTEEELRKYNGQDGEPAYIAFKGNVYDVSESKFWKNGIHFKKHYAGFDLTVELANAPHGDIVFQNCPQIGVFIATTNEISFDEKEARKERYRQWYAIYHPHPAVVHFPIALHYFSGFADVLFLSNPTTEYEAAVFLSFLIATVMGFVALIAGVFSWWINYDFATSKAFVIKLIGALFTLIVGISPLIQRFTNSDVPFSHGIDGLMYHGVIFITIISVTIVGYYGGKITWGARQ
ncbi:MAG: cytochrome b5 domain-containing protein [Sulfuricurvum sp.]|uniref:DUF2231 domain-containing protein n=1 Tax=Sulfuricurvum sp. TaxID=2025608 RepID=UPI0026101293|nr:DUF2231 domain-containing protein [Sulfuricurvum sp.]MDD2830335.1 cytochrome b5 domain-containing protein [Sulfuricurvum sp.]MDD4950794.1 cytochrome b5 domain-containing protein [Sulfuricurvum sp.]